jgi:hypothetical protein
MPPETPLGQPTNSDVPQTPSQHLWRRRAFIILVAIIILAGIGYGFSRVLTQSGPPGVATTPTPSPAPAISAAERSKVSDHPLNPTQLQVTDLAATTGSIDTLLVKALQVAASIKLRGDLDVTGNGTFTGNLTAANFQGNGSGLTGVNAELLGGQPSSFYQTLSNLSGTLRDDQLSANVALRDAANTFTANNTFSASTTFNGTTTIGNLVLSAPLGVGSGGTGLANVPAQGVLYGQGGGTLAAAVPAGAGLCLLSGASDVSWGVCGGGGAGVASVNGQTGVLTIANATGSGGTITLGDATTAAKGIASFNATNFSVAGGAVNTIQNIATTSSPTFAALTAPTVNANTIAPSAALTVGAIAQTLALQGSTTTVSANSGGFTTSLTFQAPTANVTYRLLTTGAGTYDVCTTAGNCVGTGGGVTTPGGTTNRLPKFTGVQTLGDSLVSDNGTTVTVGGNFAVTGTSNFIGALTLTTALTVPNGGTGATSLANNGVVLGQGASALTTVTAAGAGLCFLSTAGAPAFASCPSNGVTSLNSLTGALTIANATTGGSTITLNNAAADGATKGIAAFNSTNFSASSGVINTIQNIATTSTPTFTGVNTNTVTPSAAFTLGATGQAFTLQGAAGSVITATGGGFATTVGFTGTPVGAVTYNFDRTPAAGTYTICTTAGNCVGTGGGVTSPGGTTNKLAKFTAGTTIGDSIITDNGSTVSIGGTLAVNTLTPTAALTIGATTQNLTLQGATTSLTATTAGITNTLTFATPTSSGKTITLPNATGTVAVSAGGPLSLDSAGNLTCPTCVTSGGGGGGAAAVDSLNGLTGALTISNATTSGGNTVTLNNAAADGSTKGIAAFNATNFSAASGVVNTIQNINTTADPTFRNLSLNTLSVQSSTAAVVAGLIQGAASQSVDILQVKSNGVTQPNLQVTSNGVTTFTPDSDTPGSFRVNDSGTSAILFVDSTSTHSVGINTTSPSTSFALDVNGATRTTSVTTNTLTPTAALTLGATTQAFTLQGTGSSVITANGGGGTTTVGFTGTPTGAVTYQFDRAAAAGTYAICTSIGNCSGSSATLQNAYTNSTGGTTPEIKLDSTRNGIEIQDANTTIGSGNNFLSLRASNGSGLGTVRFGFGIQGNLSMQPDAALATDVLDINDTSGGNLLTLDAGNKLLGFALGSTTAPSLSGNGIEMKGALKLSGSGTSTNFTSCATPGSNTHSARICVQADDQFSSLDSFVQLGLLSTTSAGAIGLSVMDARTGTHNPSISVWSPDESQLAGFTWNGSNTQFTLQTQNQVTANTTALNLQSGNVTTANADTGAVTLQSGSVAGGTNQTSGAITIKSGNTLGSGSDSGSVTIDTGTAPDVVGGITLKTGGTSRLTVAGDGSNITVGTNTDLLLQGSTAYISNPQTQSQSEAFGLNATVSAADALAVGYNASAGSQAVAVGSGAAPTSTAGGAIAIGYHAATAGFGSPVAIGKNASSQAYSVAIGDSATINAGSGQDAVAIGTSSAATLQGVTIGSQASSGSGGTALGYAANSGGFNDSIAIGNGATTTAANQLVIGSGGVHAITQAVIGNGATNASPSGFTLQGTSGSGSNVAGASVAIAGGQGTGTGAGGAVNIKVSAAGTSGSSLNSLATVASFASTGINLGISTTVAADALVKGATNTTTAFQVQNAGGYNLMSADAVNSLVTLGRTGSTKGYTTVGGTANTGGQNGMQAQKFTTTSAGTINSIAVYFGAADSAPNNKFQVAVYTDSAGAPGTLVASSGDNTITPSSWNTAGISAALSATTSYWLAVNQNSTSGTLNETFFDSNPSFNYAFKGQTYGTWPGTYGSPGATNTIALSIYANINTASDVSAVKITSAGDVLLQGSSAHISNPQGQSQAEAFGLNASVGGTGATAVGYGATAAASAVAIGHSAGASSGLFGGPVSIGDGANAGAWGVAIGQSAGHTGDDQVSIGNGAVSQDRAIAIGMNANANTNGIAIGTGAATNGNDRIVLGYNAQGTADHQLVVGSDSSTYADAYLGRGVTSATPGSFTLHATGGSGSNIAGADMNLAGGISTGNANGGGINLQISAPGGSGSGANTLTSVASLSGANGAATFKNAANSTTAFQIQNASGAQLFNVDSTNNALTVLGNLSGETAAWQTATNTTPANRYYPSVVTANGYLYELGGSNSGAQTTVYYSKLNTDGTVGSWTTASNPLSSARYQSAAVVASGYVYMIGGTDGGGTTVSTILYAKLNPDGSVGTWQTATNGIPAARADAGAVAYNGYLYVFGGFNGGNQNTVYYSRIGADGSPGSWTSSGNTLPANRSQIATVVANGYAYVMGGTDGISNQSTIYYAKLNTDGTVGSWTNDSSHQLPAARAYGAAAVGNGYIYFMGGAATGGSPQTAVYYAKPGATGATAGWSTATQSLPVTRYGTQGTIANGYLYYVAGYDGLGGTTSVLYASLPRLQVGANLDLVGLQGQNLADDGNPSGGSTGGSITAGNGTFVGSLTVQGQTSLGGSLAVAGNAVFANAVNSTTAFQIQNSSAAAIFTADTINERLYVGPVAGDTTGALLVLGNKTTAGDPTGVAGAMYYNSNLGRFRCYDSAWKFCNDPSGLTWGWDWREDFANYNSDAAGATGSQDWVRDLSGTGAAVTPVLMDVATRPGQVQFTTGTTTTGHANLFVAFGNAIATYTPIFLGGGEEIEMAINIPTLADATNDYIIRIGLCDNNPNSGTDCGNGVYFDYTRATSTNWQIAAAAGGTRTRNTGSTPVAAATGWHRFKMVVNSAATSVEYYIDGTDVGAITTNIPTTSANAAEPSLTIIKTAGTTARTMKVDYFEYRNSLTSPR